jgi:hypothetical protein
MLRGNSAGPSKFPEFDAVAVRVSCRVAVLDDASVTSVVKVKAPARLTLPAITPVLGFRVNPFGRDPEISDQL